MLTITYLYSNSKPISLAVNITALEGGLKVAIYKTGLVMFAFFLTVNKIKNYN